MNKEQNMSPVAFLEKTAAAQSELHASITLEDAVRRTVASELPQIPELAEVDRQIDMVLNRCHPRFANMVEQVRNFRGKRFRPLMVLLSAKAVGNITPKHAALGAVMELIHTATLVHDDVLDGAMVRRHAPTVNAVHDNYNSILLGDWILSQAFSLASTLENIKINHMLSEAACRICEGELNQGLERGNLALEEGAYYDNIDGKTAELIASCCRVSAVLANAPEDQVRHLENFGRKVGMAFQVADDLLDLWGDEDRTGKSLGTDLQQGKLTLPMIHALKQPLGPKVMAILKNPPEDSTRAREALVPLLEESGSLEYTRQKAREFVQQARAELAHLPPTPWRNQLASMAEKAVARTA
jgi:octaprenyl-diphosphate synthase